MEVTLHGDFQRRDGYFSFVMYWRNKKVFRSTDYFHGLNAYKQFVETNPSFANVGLLIYTDAPSLPILQESLSGPKTTFAVVTWPEYTYKGVLDGGILRCARFQATAQFPHAWIAVRDADTLFPEATANDDFIEKLSAWEEAFLTQWLTTRSTEIVLGVSHAYQAEWHVNMLFPNLSRKVTTQTSLARRVNITKRLQSEGFTKSNNPMFFAPLGIYAGFVNFPPGLDIWSAFETYLHQRFFIIPEVGLSNKESLISAIGKDERLLLFVLLPMYQERIFYFTIVYEDEEPEPSMLQLNFPKKAFDGNIERENKPAYEDFKAIFDEFIKNYRAWASVDPAIYEERYMKLVRAAHLNKTNNTLFHPKRKTRKNRRSRNSRNSRKSRKQTRASRR